MARLRVRIHVAEPWNFERFNPTSDLIGWTVDHEDTNNDDWLVHLDKSFTMNEQSFSRVQVTARYLGERLDRILDSLATVSVNIAHPTGGAWNYDMVGTLAFQHDEN